MAIQALLREYCEANGLPFKFTNVNRWSNDEVNERISELKKLVAENG